MGQINQMDSSPTPPSEGAIVGPNGSHNLLFEQYDRGGYPDPYATRYPFQFEIPAAINPTTYQSVSVPITATSFPDATAQFDTAYQNIYPASYATPFEVPAAINPTTYQSVSVPITATSFPHATAQFDTAYQNIYPASYATPFEVPVAIKPITYQAVPCPIPAGSFPDGAVQFHVPEFDQALDGLGPFQATPTVHAPSTVAEPTIGKPRKKCTFLGCPKTFGKDSDRLRHEDSVHGGNQAVSLYLCPIAGCPKSAGAGYSRKDKLTEHMWKKHANLGYTKRVTSESI